MADDKRSAAFLILTGPSAEFATSFWVGRAGRAISWTLTAAIAIVLLFVILGAIIIGLPHLFRNSDAISAAVILGLSIVFASVVVPCLFLLLARRGTVVGMLRDVVSIEEHIARGKMHASAIQRYREQHRPSAPDVNPPEYRSR